MPEWAAAVKRFHKLESLDDFVFMINKGEWENSIAAFVQEVAETKDNRLALNFSPLQGGMASWQRGHCSLSGHCYQADR